MNWARLADPPLTPSGDEGRSLLRGELVKPDYHDRNVFERLTHWLERVLDNTSSSASSASGSTLVFALLVFALLALGLGWMLSRVRRTSRARSDSATVLTEESVSAADLRRRAEAAYVEGRFADAVVEGYRALTLRQIERGALEDLPDATAHEVAERLGAVLPERRDQVRAAGLAFDLVLYGERPATREQAAGLLSLDDDLAGVS